MPDRSTIEEFLALPEIAFVGAHRDTKQFANAVYRHLRAGGRTLVPVHPDAEVLEGDRCVHSVDELPASVRGAVVMVKPDAARIVVDDLIRHGVPMIWLHRGAGTGAVSTEAVEACRRAGVRVVDGACPLMFAEPVGWFHKAHRVLVRHRIAA